MTLTRAIVRMPAANLADGLTTAPFGPPIYEMAREQHAAYCAALRAAGLILTVLEPDAAHPDAHFVEDTAVLAPAHAILTRPGAPTRQGEAAAMRATLEWFYESVDAIEAPGTLDGGDVCDAGSHAYVGISQRTNSAGAAQLARLLERDGKAATLVDVCDLDGILHLKSGLSYIGEGRFVATDALAARLDVPAAQILRVHPDEAYGANCVWVNGTVLIPAGHPRLREDLARAGYSSVALDVSEFRKMDGGLSCLSLRF